MKPLMPKATAVWLIENTALSFEQIAIFCGLHLLEVQAIADSESNVSMVGFDPIVSGQLSLEEIKRCEKDLKAHLNINAPVSTDSVLKTKKTKYTPLAKRQERPDAIFWLIKYYPQLPDYSIVELVRSTKQTVSSIRNKTHKDMLNIKPRSPVQLGFCTQSELDQLLQKASVSQSKKQDKQSDLESEESI